MNALNADLHCHSTVSDGTLEPEAIAARAAANGVELWALTDHDEVGGQHRGAGGDHRRARALRRTARRATRRPPASPSSMPAGTKASSASSPRASAKSCIARCSPSRPAKAASSRVPAARFPACTCAMRSTLSPSGLPACWCASAATPWPPAPPAVPPLPPPGAPRPPEPTPLVTAALCPRQRLRHSGCEAIAQPRDDRPAGKDFGIGRQHCRRRLGAFQLHAGRRQRPQENLGRALEAAQRAGAV